MGLDELANSPRKKRSRPANYSRFEREREIRHERARNEAQRRAREQSARRIAEENERSGISGQEPPTPPEPEQSRRRVYFGDPFNDGAMVIKSWTAGESEPPISSDTAWLAWD